MPLLTDRMIPWRERLIAVAGSIVGRKAQSAPQTVVEPPPAGCAPAIDIVHAPLPLSVGDCDAPPSPPVFAEALPRPAQETPCEAAAPLEKRRSRREKVIMPVRCRTKDGQTGRVILSDLSAHGCRLYSDDMKLRKGQWITIQPSQMEGIPAIVRWIDERRAGVEFERPLYGAVAEHLQRLFAVPDNLSATGVRVVSSSISPLAQPTRR